MPKVSVANVEKAPVVPPPSGSDAAVETRAIFARDVDPIHVFVHHVPDGGILLVEGLPSETLLYVWKGAVSAGDTHLDAGSSVIVEYGAGLKLAAASGGAELVGFVVANRDPTLPSAGQVHLLPSQTVPRVENLNGLDIGTALYADATCPTCRIWMHENHYRGDGDDTGVHSHSEDEVIFVTEGSIKLGNRLSGPGTAIAVAANTKYGVASGPDGMRFINFRGASPTYAAADGSLVLDEGEFWRNAVGKPQYLDGRQGGAPKAGAWS